MTATKKQLEDRARRLESAVSQASTRLLNVQSGLVATVVTDVESTYEWSGVEFPPLNLKTAAVIEIFESHSLDSDIYAYLKLVPELSSLVIAAQPDCTVVMCGSAPLTLALQLVVTDLPMVFIAISTEEIIELFDGNAVRSIISLVNRAR